MFQSSLISFTAMVSPLRVPETDTRSFSDLELAFSSSTARLLPDASSLMNSPFSVRIPNPAFWHWSAQARVCASGLAAALALHIVSIKGTLTNVVSSAVALGAVNRKAARTAATRMACFMNFSFSLVGLVRRSVFPQTQGQETITPLRRALQCLLSPFGEPDEYDGGQGKV